MNETGEGSGRGSVKVTLDFNMLLDVSQKREPHYAASAQVVSWVACVGDHCGNCQAPLIRA